MHRLRIVSYHVRPKEMPATRLTSRPPLKNFKGPWPMTYEELQFSKLRSKGAEIRVYHPTQERAIADAAWDGVTVIAAPHPTGSRFSLDSAPIEPKHPLLLVDSFREMESLGSELDHINRIYHLLGNIEGDLASSLHVWIEPQQLTGWLLQWEHHLRLASVKNMNLEGREVQEYLYKKLVSACYYC